MRPFADERRVSRRISSIHESATLKLDARAKALKAKGRSVIGFVAGEPDFATPEFIVEAAVDAARDSKNHRYTPTGGLPELKEAIISKTERDSLLSVSNSELLVTNGGKQAVFEAFAALVNPGDEVIVPTPCWTTYLACIRLAGGLPIEVFANEEQGYKVTCDQLDRALTDKAKVLVLVSPSNPTGAVYTADELQVIGDWAARKGLWVITDEIYEHLTYDDVQTGSLPALCPQIRDSTVIVNGVAKAYAMTGWRVGWMIAPPDIIKAATNLQSQTTSNVSNVSQRAAIAALNADLSVIRHMHAAFARRRELMVKMLNDIEGFECPTPSGAFYAYPSVKTLIGKSFKGRHIASSADLAEYILEQAEVAVVPGEAFGPSGYLRLSYSLGDDEIAEGLDRLRRLFS